MMKNAICDFHLGVAKTTNSALAVTRLAGTLALPVVAFVVAIGAALPSFAEKPYDAVVEYLEADGSAAATGSVNPYIVTSLMPADDLGAYFRFTSLSTGDYPLFGKRSAICRVAEGSR